MGLFKKKVNKKENVSEAPVTLPELPKLPALPPIDDEESNVDAPKLPSIDEDVSKSPLPKLPSFPNNDFGNKFSQDSIKEAVSGKKEGDEVSLANDFVDEEQTMQEPLKKPSSVEHDDFDDDRKPSIISRSREVPSNFRGQYSSTRKAEPIFVRLDKFEESLKTFEKAKEQILEIENLIKHTKALKEKEEEELLSWEKEIQLIKQEIEKIDRDIFSKIE